MRSSKRCAGIGNRPDLAWLNMYVYNSTHPVPLRGRATTAIVLLFILAACGRASSPSDPSEIKSGEPDYPVTNPHPTHVLAIDATIPSVLSVGITAIYLASPTAGGTMESGTACQRTVGLAVTAPFALRKPVTLVHHNGTYTASVAIDGLVPGRCAWKFSHLNYVVRTAEAPPDRSDNELAGYKGDGPEIVVTNIWCMRYPVRQNFRPEVCDSLDSLASDFSGDIPVAIVRAVPSSERKEGPPLTIGPRTTSMRIVFHDLDQIAH